MMVYQNAALPDHAKFAGSTPEFTEATVPKPILNKHMAPAGKCGYLVVQSGALQFVWEDTGETFDAAPGHPVVIAPERYHHVQITGPVKFKIEFYALPAPARTDDSASRPGEAFLTH